VIGFTETQLAGGANRRQQPHQRQRGEACRRRIADQAQAVVAYSRSRIEQGVERPVRIPALLGRGTVSLLFPADIQPVAQAVAEKLKPARSDQNWPAVHGAVQLWLPS
jgi:hypothetical protein